MVSRVTSDKAHIEKNEPALTLIAGVACDTDFRRNGPFPDMAATTISSLAYLESK
jgi:hypothetical protein